jgi:pimeloyl-ACP methyl ester carboxylesterase
MGRHPRRRRALIASLLLFMGSACTHHAAKPATQPVVPSTVPSSVLAGVKAFEGPLYTIAVGAVTLAYRRFGSGPPLVMLLGDDSATTEWPAYLLRPLSSSFQVTILDYPGIGSSTDDLSKPLTVPLLADDVAAFIAALGLRQPAVLGWSFGGEIALALAVNHPEVARALVTSGADAGSAHAVQADPATIRKLYDPKTPPAQLLGLLFPKGAPGISEYIGDYLGTEQEDVRPETLQRQLAAEEAFAADSSVFDHLGDLTIPVLVTNGTEDVLVPVANARILADRIPRAQLMLFTQAGHGMLLQDAARFAAAVRVFLAG